MGNVLVDVVIKSTENGSADRGVWCEEMPAIQTSFLVRPTEGGGHMSGGASFGVFLGLSIANPLLNQPL